MAGNNGRGWKKSLELGGGCLRCQSAHSTHEKVTGGTKIAPKMPPVGAEGAFCLSDQISHWPAHTGQCCARQQAQVDASFIRSCFCLLTCGVSAEAGRHGSFNPKPPPFTLQSISHTRHTMTAVSAPGKVLLAGGYLVLDRAYTGLVFGLSARIHVVVRDRDSTTTEHSQPEIAVQSPQFRDALWAYSYQAAADEGGMDVIQTPG